MLLWVALSLMVAPHARNHDFLNLYTGASLALDGRFSQLHDTGVQLDRERELVPETRVLIPFVRPHFHALLIAPLALIPFAAAFYVWTAGQWLLYGGFGWWAQRRLGGDSMVWWAAYVPGAMGIIHGQDSALMLAILTAGFALSEKDRPVAAGLVWSLLLMKFHLCFGLAVALAAARMWVHLAGFTAGGALLAATSLALGGLTGAAHYVNMLTNKDLERLSPAPAKMLNFQGLAASAGVQGEQVLAAGAVIGLALAAAAAWKSPPRLALAAGVAGGLFAAPHVYIYDLTFLLLPLLLLKDTFRTTPVRWSAALMLAPVFTGLAVLHPPWSAGGSIGVLTLLVSLVWARRSGDLAEK